MNTEPPSLAVVAAVNDNEVLAKNLAISPMLDKTRVPLIVKRGYKSAASAYNAGLDCADADIVIFAHQDVYLPQGWEKKLLSAIQTLEVRGKKWGVLGVVGSDAIGNLVGGAWSTGLQRKIESQFSSPAPVKSLDEIVLVLRKSTGLRFDNNLPGYHLYGTDIALSALKAGLWAYVFDAPVIHNSLRCKKLGLSYSKAYQHMQIKWWSELPIRTLVLPLTRTRWPLLRNWYCEKKKWLVREFNGMRPGIRHEAPSQIAQHLGYECAE